MKKQHGFLPNKPNLAGKTIAVSGCTGGLGKALCFHLADCGAGLIMLDRNAQKAERLERELREYRRDMQIQRIVCELENIHSVKSATQELIEKKPDVLIANAGAYSIPRRLTSCGYDNVFQINFVSPYFMIRKLHEALPDIKIVAVGSIAHTYSKIDLQDMDFRTRKSSAKVYGNSKRILMLALCSYFEKTPECVSIVHPGITFTNITAHYPKPIFAIIKHPMKLIFMKPKKAAECLLSGIAASLPFGHWIGPAILGIWGKPKEQKLRVAFTDDCKKAAAIGEQVYSELKE